MLVATNNYDLTKMSDFDIEEELHPLIFRQFAARAVFRGMEEKELAARVGITDVHFSRIKHGDRRLPVKLARAVMTELNYRAIQIDRIEEILRHFHSTRNKRRASQQHGGLNKLRVKIHVIDDKNHRGVLLRVTSRRNTKRCIEVIIDCKGGEVIYMHSKQKNHQQEMLSGQEAAKYLLPNTKNAVAIFLARILTVLQFEWYKALVADLDQLDIEPDTIHRLSRMASVRGKDTPSTLLKAQRVFWEHVGI